MDGDKLTEAILETLETGEALNELATMAVDSFLDQPIGDLLDAEIVADHVLRFLSGPAPGRLVADHLLPALALERERVEESGERLSDCVPEEIVVAIEARLGRPILLPRGFFDNLVEPHVVQKILTESLAEALEGFLARMPLGSAAGSLLGSLARKTPGALPFSRIARDLAAQSAGLLRDRILERLRSQEHRPTLERTRRRVLKRVLALKLRTLHRMADDPGPAELARWAQATLAHNLARDEIRAAVRTQVAAAIERVRGQPLRDWLDASDMLRLREELVRQASTQARRLVASPALRDWLERLLSEALSRS